MSLLLSLLLIPIAKPQTPQWDLSQKITYSTVAKSAKKVCEELTKQTHISFDTERATASEVLVIDVKDVPLKTLLDKIANVSSAQWETSSSEMKLVRPSEVARKEAQEEIAFYTSRIEKSIKAAAVKVAKASDYDTQAPLLYSQQYKSLNERANDAPGREIFDQLRELDRNTPIGRLCDRLVQCIDAKKLATMRQDETIVFSTSPNRLQLPFNSQAALATKQFAKDWALWTESGSNLETPSRFFSSFISGLKSGKQPAKIIMVCTWGDLRTTIETRTYAITSDGYILAETNSDLPVDEMLDSLGRSLDTGKETTKEVPGSGVSFSPMAQAWANRVRELMEPIKDAKPVKMDDLDKWALNPLDNDPLSLHPSEATIAIAKSKSKNLVASLPDQSILVGLLAVMGVSRSSAEYVDLLQKSSGIVFSEDGTWLIAKPEIPSRTRRERFDRTSLGLLYRDIKGKGYLSLDEMAGFCYNNDRNAMSELSLMGFLMLTGDMNSIAPLIEHHSLLGFYGSLLPVQRSTLLQSGPVFYKDLAGEQRLRFERILFGRSDRMMSTSYRTDSSGLSSTTRIPTEAYPNGAPPNSSLSIGVTKATIAQSNDQFRQAFSPQQIAQNILAKERPDIYGGYVQNLDRTYRMGELTSYKFNFNFMAEIGSSTDINVVQIDQRQTPVSYKGLPKIFLDEVEKEVVRLRQIYQNMQPPTDPPVKKV